MELLHLPSWLIFFTDIFPNHIIPNLSININQHLYRVSQKPIKKYIHARYIEHRVPERHCSDWHNSTWTFHNFQWCRIQESNIQKPKLSTSTKKEPKEHLMYIKTQNVFTKRVKETTSSFDWGRIWVIFPHHLRLICKKASRIIHWLLE